MTLCGCYKLTRYLYNANEKVVAAIRVDSRLKGAFALLYFINTGCTHAARPEESVTFART